MPYLQKTFKFPTTTTTAPCLLADADSYPIKPWTQIKYFHKVALVMMFCHSNKDDLVIKFAISNHQKWIYSHCPDTSYAN